jgi:hypothetical protein
VEGNRKSKWQIYISRSLLLVLKSREAVGLQLALLLLAERLHRTARELLVEVRNVGVGSQDGHEGRLDRTTQQRVPVHLLEPGVVADLVCGYRPQPVPGVLLQQAHEEVLQLGRGLRGAGSTLGTWRGW